MQTGNPSQQQRARLRVCMSCEWIYERKDEKYSECPKCKWPSYGARFVYGNKAYRYMITQKPWRDRKLATYSYELDKEITETNPIHPVRQHLDFLS